MLLIFAAAIFLSAALLFTVQPMSGKLLLPLLGGSPAVWNTCMVFFQGLLLLGYLYSHLVTRRLGARAQAMTHACVLVAAFLPLLWPGEVGVPGDHPIDWLLLTLARRAGLPFFVLSTTGPLLQRWFSRTDHPAAKDPYFLYVASNFGSIVGLLAYPVAMEPLLARPRQESAWAWGYAAFVPLALACAGFMLARRRPGAEAPAAGAPTAAPVTRARRLRWLALALVPSSLMLGVTQHISTDIAAVPLLWIIPLLLYLVTLMIAFSGLGRVLTSRFLGRYALPVLVLAMMVAMLTSARQPVLIIIGLHLLTFFVAALMCHTRLAEDRPGPEHLTEFYLVMSLGGVLGGAVNAMVAPSLFNTVLEYPLMIGAVCLLRPQVTSEGSDDRVGRLVRAAMAVATALVMFGAVFALDRLMQQGLDVKVRDRFKLDENTLGLVHNALLAGPLALAAAALLVGRGSLRFALAVTAVLVAAPYIGSAGRVIYRERTFFGVLTVTANTPVAFWHTLSHGTTLHGIQAWREGLPANDPDTPFQIRRSFIPTTYYHPSGPLGDVMRSVQQLHPVHSVGLVGMGAGTAAAYARPGSTFFFYEIDPAVIRIANDPHLFTYIADATAKNSVKLPTDPQIRVGMYCGDGRLGMIQRAADGPHDLIVLDAFSSDAIPIHLLTLEAFKVYLSRLKPDGIIAVHISNRFFDLRPVLTRIAAELHLEAYTRDDNVVTSDQSREAKRESMWMVLAHRAEDFAPYSTLPTWEREQPRGPLPLWTDDYSNILDRRVFVHFGGR